MAYVRRCAVLLALLVAPAAAAGPPPKPASQPTSRARHTTARLEPTPRRGTPSRSIGSPTDGHLLGGARLGDAPYLRFVPAYATGDARWGLEGLVGTIDHAARAVRKQFPDAVLSVGHLSKRGGGEIDRHASHESGRDADIGFFVKNHKGKPVFADHFVAFRGDGTAPTWPGARFDDARNWALIAAIAGESRAHVSHVFVSLPLRARLLAYAQKIGAPYALRVRASELMVQPRGALPHDDHFHVRIACPSGMEKCVEQPMARRSRQGAVARSQRARPRGELHAGGPRPAAPATPPSRARAASPAPPRMSQGTSRGTSQGRPRVRGEPADDVREDARDETASSRSEPLVPSLAPIVPGLDTAIIPAPLAERGGDSRDEMPALPDPDRAPVDDPDGVLEER